MSRMRRVDPLPLFLHEQDLFNNICHWRSLVRQKAGVDDYMS